VIWNIQCQNIVSSSITLLISYSIVKAW
jgi:hypothetical protein